MKIIIVCSEIIIVCSEIINVCSEIIIVCSDYRRNCLRRKFKIGNVQGTGWGDIHYQQIFTLFNPKCWTSLMVLKTRWKRFLILQSLCFFNLNFEPPLVVMPSMACRRRRIIFHIFKNASKCQCIIPSRDCPQRCPTSGNAASPSSAATPSAAATTTSIPTSSSLLPALLTIGRLLTSSSGSRRRTSPGSSTGLH